MSLQHEVSEGFVRKIGKNYFMRLVVDGQKKQRKTGTDDPEKAAAMLQDWRKEEELGFQADTRLRYEDMRDNYLQSGKHVQQSRLDELNEYFKNIRLAAITTGKLKAFREWRESNHVVLEHKERTYQQEVALRKLKLGRKPTPKESAEIEKAARIWVENATKATTNRVLGVLQAMFNHLVKEERISKSDVPYIPKWDDVDNVRTGTVSDKTFSKILAEVPKILHPYLRFLKATGRRSGEVAQYNWDMVNEERTVLSIPATITKTKEPQTLPLVDKQGKPFDWSEWIVNAVRFEGRSIFDITDFRNQWRLACHKLGLGVYDEENHTYRGLKPHDFRRTAISNMTAKGGDRAGVKSITGHKTDSAFNRYDIKDLSHQQAIFEMVGK
jgi:integrase